MKRIAIVLLNGPSGSGKTTQGKAAATRLAHVTPTMCFGFADDLKRATHASLGMFDVPFDQFENCKNTPMPEFLGLTPRKAYISHSEEYMKKVYGDNVFTVLAARRIVRAAQNWKKEGVVVLTDCGFIVEAKEFIRVFGVENVFCIRLHRKGRTFEGDSRGYIHPDCQSIDLNNDVEFDQFNSLLYWTILGFVQPPLKDQNASSAALEK